LVGLTLNGIAIARKDYVKNYLSVRSNERSATVYANKAITYGIVEKDGPVFKIGGRNAGTSVDSVVAAMLSDTDMFDNYVKPEVDRMEKAEMVESKTNIEESLELPSELKDLIPVVTASAKKRAGKI
jgi:hypothetical protein